MWTHEISFQETQIEMKKLEEQLNHSMSLRSLPSDSAAGKRISQLRVKAAASMAFAMTPAHDPKPGEWGPDTFLIYVMGRLGILGSS